MAQKPVETEDSVHLKPIMGIQPGIYLTVLYSIILLIILFFLFVFPGMRNPGVILGFKTEPEGAALRVNGIYMGTSGSNETIFVPKGTHIFEAVLPGFESQSVILEIPGRVFGSLFFPLRYPLRFTLKAENPSAVFAEAAGDFASWTFGGEATAAWQIPLSLSEGAYRIGYTLDPVNEVLVYEMLAAASRFTVTRAALRDLIRAKMLLDNSGLSPSPASITGSVSDILSFLSENEGSAGWLSGLLPAEYAQIIRDSDWYKNETLRETVSGIPQSAAQDQMRIRMPVTIYGISFTVQNGLIAASSSVPRTVFENYLREQETERQREDLAEIFSLFMPDSEIITGVTLQDAVSFCKWLTNLLPPYWADMEVRLPTEAEWEILEPANIPFVWEWCGDPFAPLTFISVSQDAMNAVGSPEYVIRQQGSARSSFPPDLSSPYLTFRPIIAPKDN